MHAVVALRVGGGLGAPSVAERNRLGDDRGLRRGEGRTGKRDCKEGPHAPKVARRAPGGELDVGARCGRAEAVRAVVVAGAVMCRARAVTRRRHTRLQARGDLVGLRLRQIARLDGSCQLGLLCRDERCDEAGSRLAVRRFRDLRQSLPGLELSEERVLGDAQVRGRRGEPVAVAAVPVARAAGAVTAEGAVDLGGLVRLQVGGELGLPAPASGCRP